MSENIKEEDLIEKIDPTSESTEEKAETEMEVETEVKVDAEQDPLKTELERVQTSGRSELEKAEYSLKKNAERLKELGGDPNDVLGIRTDFADDEDDRPLTIGAFKKIQQASSTKTALQLADEIQNETERELTKYHLNNSIKSTGTPSEDLKLAKALVNAVKNSQILEEVARKTDPKKHSSASGADAKQPDELKGELTKEEMMFMKKPFSLTKKQILEARKG